MGYQLGVDLGTTYTAAAISRADAGGRVTTELFHLGTQAATVPSVLFLPTEGPDSVVVGEAAQRRALTDPDRVVREFKRRVGDETPIMVGGESHTAESLVARMLRWVVDRVTEREGEPPTEVAVTHPASWGGHKRQLLADALAKLDLPPVTFLSEPQAAAVCYASAEKIEPGATIAVYDFGGGTFDAAVVKSSPSGGFELLGQPQGIDRLGGADIDEAIFEHVLESLTSGGAELPEMDEQDPVAMSAVSRLRRECTEAKEALSSDTEVTIPVLLLDVRSNVRLVRAEFEGMIRPALEETVDALRAAISAAGMTVEDLSGVLLVGGSSRIPLVAQIVSEELGRPVSVDADPKAVVAMGAALALVPLTELVGEQPAPAAVAVPETPVPAASAAVPAAVVSTAAVPAVPPKAAASPVPIVPTAVMGGPPPRPVGPYDPYAEVETHPRRRRRLISLALTAAASLLIVLSIGSGVANVPGVDTVDPAVADDTPPSSSPTPSPTAKRSSADRSSERSSGGASSQNAAESMNSTQATGTPTPKATAETSTTPIATTSPQPTPTTSTQQGTTPPTSPPPSDPPSDPPPSDPPPSDPPPSDPPPSDPPPSDPPPADPPPGTQQETTASG